MGSDVLLAEVKWKMMPAILSPHLALHFKLIDNTVSIALMVPYFWTFRSIVTITTGLTDCFPQCVTLMRLPVNLSYSMWMFVCKPPPANTRKNQINKVQKA